MYTGTLNEAQAKILQWIADGCPAGVMHGYEHRISAAALRTRNLVRVSGHGEAWTKPKRSVFWARRASV